jgi:ribosomal protein S13
MSAPVFEIGEGDPFENISYLHELGPNALLYPGEKFKSQEFVKRLTTEPNLTRTIGSALLDQTIVAGLGNYLRAEILFEAKLDPWRTVETLTQEEIAMISHLVPSMTERAYKNDATVKDADRERMRNDNSLVYVPGKEYGTRHYVFRRTNLPCLVCGTPIKQLRQETGPAKTAVGKKTDNGQPGEDEDEKTRIIYFCQKCQQVRIPTKTPPGKKVRKNVVAPTGGEQKAATGAPGKFSGISNESTKTSRKQPVEPKVIAKQKTSKQTMIDSENLTSAKKSANQSVAKLDTKPSRTSDKLLQNTPEKPLKPNKKASGAKKKKITVIR